MNIIINTINEEDNKSQKSKYTPRSKLDKSNPKSRLLMEERASNRSSIDS